MLKPPPKTRDDFELDWTGLVVKIIWEDVLHCDEVSTEEGMALEPPFHFRSYGEIVGKTAHNITIASTIGNQTRDKKIRDTHRIRLELVEQIIILGEIQEVTI